MFALGCRLWDRLSKVSFDLIWRHRFFPGLCMALSIFACAGKEGIVVTCTIAPPCNHISSFLSRIHYCITLLHTCGQMDVG
jgi:hypothetical protein